MRLFAYAMRQSWGTGCAGLGQAQLGRGATLAPHRRGHATTYLLMQGVVSVARTGADGREAVIEVITPGKVTGELSLLGEVSEARATATQPTTVMWLCAKQGHDWLQRDPRAEELALRLTSLKLRRAQDRAFELMFGSAGERVALVLLDLVDRLGTPRGGQIVVDHGLTQMMLAQLAGVCRETLSRVMRDFRRRGWVTTSIGTCSLRDPTALRRYARAAATGALPLRTG